MRTQIKMWWRWASARPTVIINLVGLAVIIIGGGAYLTYQSFRPLDVLRDWHIAISSPQAFKTVDGKRLPVYHPGESLVFTSTSVKLIDVTGLTSRMIVCDATDKLKEREIQLDTSPATRPAGYNPARENAVVVPDVTQFAGLPRTCRLVIDIAYENVALGRGYNEHAQTGDFIVEEEPLDAASIRRQISDLNARIKDLEKKLSAAESSRTVIVNPQPQQSTQPRQTEQKQNTSSNGQSGGGNNNNGNNNNGNNNSGGNDQPQDDGFQLHDILPILKGIGL